MTGQIGIALLLLALLGVAAITVAIRARNMQYWLGGYLRPRRSLVPRLSGAGFGAPGCRRPTAAAHVLLSRRGIPGGTPRQDRRTVRGGLWRDRDPPASRRRYRGQLQGHDQPLQCLVARAPRC